MSFGLRDYCGIVRELKVHPKSCVNDRDVPLATFSLVFTAVSIASYTLTSRRCNDDYLDSSSAYRGKRGSTS
jgi:hypothetical protein